MSNGKVAKQGNGKTSENLSQFKDVQKKSLDYPPPASPEVRPPGAKITQPATKKKS